MTTPGYEDLAARFRPVFAKIAEGAVDRETTRTLAREPVAWLRERASARCASRSRTAGPARRSPSCSGC